MRPGVLLRRFVLLACFASLGALAPNLSQALAADSLVLSRGVRERLSRAASDPKLAPWQRDFMLGLSSGGPLPSRDSIAAIAPDPPLNPAWAPSMGAWSGTGEASTRISHSAIYDPVRDRMLVFGGYDGSYRHDVWALSLPGTPHWTALNPTGTWPGARYGHTAIYDPLRDRMLVFGGLGASGHLNDAWALSLADAPSWSALAPTGTLPGGRVYHSAIYDPVRDRMLVFAGQNGSGYLNDAWSLSLAGTPTWATLTPTGAPPSARSTHSAIYDPVRDRLLMFGGHDGSYRNDVWVLTLAGTPAWTALVPASMVPGARAAHTAIYDPVRDRMWVFGGYAYSYRNDVWALYLAGTPAWAALTPTGTSPSARDLHSTIYDPVRDRMVVFGGNDGSSHNDVWLLAMAGTPAWTTMVPMGPPPGERDLHSAIYDPVRDRMVVFGGETPVPPYDTNDVWSLALAGEPTWSALTPTGTPPSARTAHSAIYDPVRDCMLMFGGYDGSYRNDVWALSLAGEPAWAALTPTGTQPGARAAHSAIYDPVRDRMLVFGGSDGSLHNDVWSLSLAGTPAWMALAPTGTPPTARDLQSAIYDPVRDRMLVFGGYDGTSRNDLWALSLAGTPGWSSVPAAGRAAMTTRDGHSAIYDPVRDRMVVFGGATTFVYSYLRDVWTLSLSGVPAWSVQTPLSTPPNGSFGHSAIYDPLRGRMVVFGGRASASPYYRNDTNLLTWGAPPDLTCPGDIIWIPGTRSPLNYVVTNPNASRQTADYTLTGGRNWPGFPIAGSVTLDANGTMTVPISIPVPDTALDGPNPLTFMVALREVELAASCSHLLNLREGPTPAQPSLVSAQAEPGRVRLTWYCAAGAGLLATVHRRTTSDAWRAMGEIAADGSGLIVLEDRQVSHGRYGYRLAVMEQGRETFVGETWVDVPLALVLVLGGAQPNPAAQHLTVAFSLPDAAPARLEVLDVAGRRVAAREVGSLGGGSHVVPLGESQSMAPGIYLLRLTRGGRALTTRVAIVR